MSAGWVFLIAGPAAGAVLTLGLIRRWGRVAPSWVPLVGGRRVPRWLPVELDGNWAFAGTYPVFLLWGVSLLLAAAGYADTTRRSQR